VWSFSSCPSLAGFFNDMYPSETTRSILVGKGSFYMRLTVSEENMTLKKPSTHRGTMPDSQESPGELCSTYIQCSPSFHGAVEQRRMPERTTGVSRFSFAVDPSETVRREAEPCKQQIIYGSAVSEGSTVKENRSGKDSRRNQRIAARCRSYDWYTNKTRYIKRRDSQPSTHNAR